MENMTRDVLNFMNGRRRRFPLNEGAVQGTYPRVEDEGDLIGLSHPLLREPFFRSSGTWS